MVSNLSSENAEFVRQQIASGAFTSSQDAIEHAVTLLRQRTALIDRLDKGTQQLDSGEYVELDEAGMDQFFADLVRAAEHKGSDEAK